MAHKLLVATYNQDIEQFEIFCHCLAKNWKGNRFITVVANSIVPYTNDKDWHKFFEQITVISEQKLHEWNVEVIDGRHPDHNGYREQAVNKVIHSIDHRFEDVVVFDAKDFLLKDTDISAFRTDNFYRVTYYLKKRLVDLYGDAHELFDRDMSHIPAVLNLTPWIWNVCQLEKYWTYMLDRFGPYLNWNNMYKAGTESDSYYAYSFCDPEKTFKFFLHQQNPLLIAGGWTTQTYEGMLEQAAMFEQQANLIIWKHSRKLQDPRCLDVTKSVLKIHGIDSEFVQSVYG